MLVLSICFALLENSIKNKTDLKIDTERHGDKLHHNEKVSRCAIHTVEIYQLNI